MLHMYEPSLLKIQSRENNFNNLMRRRFIFYFHGTCSQIDDTANYIRETFSVIFLSNLHNITQ